MIYIGNVLIIEQNTFQTIATMTFSHRIPLEELLQDDPEFKLLNNPNRLHTFTRIVVADNDLKSASKWDSRYYAAAKVHMVERLDPKFVVPEEYYPSEQELEEHGVLFEATRGEILEKAVPNPGIYALFFLDLRELLAFGSGNTVASDVSDVSVDTRGTNDEDKAEKVAEKTLLGFLNLWNCQDICGPGRFDIDGTTMELDVRSQSFHGRLTIQGSLVNSLTDGYGAVTHCNRDGKKRVSTTVAFGVEAKRHLHKKNDVAITAQVAAEAIAIAQHNEKKKSHGTPEVFIFFIHHRRCYLVSAVFSSNYLKNLEGTGLAAEDYMVLKKTKEFDLAKGEDRKKFAKCVTSLFRYLKSGHARMGVLDFETRDRSIVG
ncbi:uncharacterized protein SPPG_02438 [Spizellomyces punctatus DAOM BR117]|uniref:Uncharacterized protein n=1 Tax=Spizellomyces punctatus (strain DAOM BR117) TaxID=645134 RepID=A0A0L0HKD9_SPIPD|nr:uncharacterized protein SPPG_02438 [Spizellomyces punctatus DAOM BR117]KND01931.1 hypothetical protein SPPG_02438 [Spizellomyces punctatus DAOM BR117]|eukprot:XP_016609970.1 hypothetical protein SPPG_02438 [Spizellomyces punctatus DAOM BR117]